MDTKAGELIVQAFRDGNFLAGKEASTGEELVEALPRLNSLLFSLVGLELGEKYQDWPVPPNRASVIPSRYPRGPLNEDLDENTYLNPPANVRLMVSITTPTTIYFPNAPRDGARMAYADVGSTAQVTLHGNGRLVQAVASVSGQGGSRRWFYRADQGNWVCLDTLQMDSLMPLPPEFDELFICGLILRLSTRYAVTPPAYVEVCYRDSLARLKKRYAQSEEMPTTGAAGFPTLGGGANIATGREW